METKRLTFHQKLKDFLKIKNVYFQPPESFKMAYPCAVYMISGDSTRFANNRLYYDKVLYQVSIIDRDPDSALFHKMRRFRYSRFVRHFVASNLHNWIFNVYY